MARPGPAPPLIGIVTHELRAEADRAWAPTAARGERALAPARLTLRLSYTQAVQEAGGLAVVLPAHGYVDDTGALLDRVAGLVFSGGPDLDPAVYGQARHPALGPHVDVLVTEARTTRHRQPAWYRYAAAMGGGKPVVIVENPYGGGVVPDASLALNVILSRLYGKNGKIPVPGFYDAVRKLSGVAKRRQEAVDAVRDNL